ncbi:MAG: type II toxin-antitoxin system RelE/ParE family toxin [Actinomycetota bacterium]|nr:type II toxin-antitoxin system RelE/ParE family toxin [Actinomycetota bacterium]
MTRQRPPARLRPLAETDLIERTRWYRSAGGEALAVRFFNAALAALRSPERMPGIGSPLAGEWAGIPGLRARPVTGFPVQWYYFVADDHLDVVRLLADAQDLPVVLRLGDTPQH